jgi:IS4 transposase
VADNLQVKEVVLDDGTMRDRFVVCRNPDEAQRDAHIRAEIVERLETAIADTDRLSERKRAELAGRLKTRPAYNRFLRVTPKSGLLRIDRAAIAADVKLDGKFLLRTSDPTLDAEDVALGYKQLLQVERGWRDLKLHLDLRPVFHRREDRIRAHVLLCWLALLLTRIAENAAGDTWRNLRRELHQLAAIESAGPDGTIIETTRPTPAQQRIYTACNVALPPRFLGIHPA